MKFFNFNLFGKKEKTMRHQELYDAITAFVEEFGRRNDFDPDNVKAYDKLAKMWKEAKGDYFPLGLEHAINSKEARIEQCNDYSLFQGHVINFNRK